jgi:hypothetical protein
MRRTRLSITAATVVAVLALAGCSGDDGSDDNAEPTPAPTQTPAPSEETTTPTESSEPTESTSPTEEPSSSAPPDGPINDSPPARAKQSSIAAGQLPGFNEQWTWQRRSAGPGPGQDMPSVCMKAPLTAIGAVSEYRTDYDSDLSANSWAVVMTAVLPDSKTGQRAQSVLETWQRDCAQQASSLGLKRVRVTPVRTTDTAVGVGEHVLVTYRPVAGDPDAGWFQAEGFVRDGDTLTYVIITTAGQDYNYETGAEPMDQALAVAGDRLLQTRP